MCVGRSFFFYSVLRIIWFTRDYRSCDHDKRENQRPRFSSRVYRQYRHTHSGRPCKIIIANLIKKRRKKCLPFFLIGVDRTFFFFISQSTYRRQTRLVKSHAFRVITYFNSFLSAGRAYEHLRGRCVRANALNHITSRYSSVIIIYYVMITRGRNDTMACSGGIRTVARVSFPWFPESRAPSATKRRENVKKNKIQKRRV